jgi:hypothetical protein
MALQQYGTDVLCFNAFCAVFSAALGRQLSVQPTLENQKFRWRQLVKPCARVS